MSADEVNAQLAADNEFQRRCEAAAGPRKMIETLDDLREWIDDAPTRHQRVDDFHCSCGWFSYPACEVGDETLDWSWHTQGGPLHDLLSYLPGCYRSDGTVESYAELLDALFAAMDDRYA